MPVQLLDSPAAYHADFALVTGGQSYRGQVRHMKGRARYDYAVKDDPQAVVVRMDQDKLMVLWPARRWYISSSIEDAAAMVGGIDRFALDTIRDGQEVVADEPCTRYLVTSNDFNGRIWTTSDGVVMRVRGTYKENERTTSVAMQLDHLVRGPVESKVFDTPQGWFGLPLDMFKGK